MRTPKNQLLLTSFVVFFGCLTLVSFIDLSILDSGLSKDKLTSLSCQQLKEQLVATRSASMVPSIWIEMTSRKTRELSDADLVDLAFSKSIYVADPWLAMKVRDPSSTALALKIVEQLRKQPELIGVNLFKSLSDLSNKRPPGLRLAAAEALVRNGKIEVGQRILFELARKPELRERVRFRLVRLTGLQLPLETNVSIGQIDQQIKAWKNAWPIANN